MALKRSHSNWTKRPTDLEKKIEPYRKYVFICEGENTENWYFSHLIKMKKELGIHPLIEIQLLEKTEGKNPAHIPKIWLHLQKDRKSHWVINMTKNMTRWL